MIFMSEDRRWSSSAAVRFSTELIGSPRLRRVARLPGGRNVDVPALEDVADPVTELLVDACHLLVLRGGAGR